MSGKAGGPTATIALAVALVATAPAGAVASQGGVGTTLRSEQALPLIYNQGVARVAGGWILSGTNSPLPGTDLLARTDEQLHVLLQNQPAIPAQWRAQGYNHIGDIDVVGNVIFAPFEQDDYTKGFQVTARYDATTLLFIDAVVLPQHENSFVAVDPATMTAYTMDHFDGDSLFRYDVVHGWKPLPPLHLSVTLHHTQGASVSDGAIWISTSDDHNGLYRVDQASGDVDPAGTLGHPGGEGEGITAAALPSGRLHALVIDPNLTTVWFAHFDVSAGPVGNAAAAPSTAGSAGGGRASPSASGRGAASPATGRGPGWLWGGLAALAAALVATAVKRAWFSA